MKKLQKRHNQVVFKPYQQDQMWLFPPSLGEMIPPHHIVRLISKVIDGMDLQPILSTYKGGGTSSYHPRMMLKALVYGYVCKKYSSRSIEKALQENICFMWLCGMQQPDHNSLNRFRRGKLKDTVKSVFAHILSLLIEEGQVRLQDYYVDGTKMESVANRYSFVWAKNVERYKSSILNKIAALLEKIESTNDSVEQAAANPEQATPSKEKIEDSQALQQTITQLNQEVSEQLTENKTLKKQIKQLEKEYLPKLAKYEEQERLLNGRSSYAKTDPDATFMRTKDDHMKNGQLKPCYSWQFGTENQYVINYTTHQTPSDMAVFTSHMDDTLDLLDSIDVPPPKRAGADAGYGSEENYEYLEQKGIEAFVKYPGYYAECTGKGKNQKNPFYWQNLYYNKEQDYFVCPMGQHLTYQKTVKQKTKTGFEQQVKLYQAQNCKGCPLRGACHKAKENRTIQFNPKSNQYRQQAKQRLQTLRGIRSKKQRNIDVEAVFGHIKQCRHFRRFLLTGLDGVNIETGLLVIAHNLKKYDVNLKKQGITRSIWPDNPPNNPHIVALVPVFEEKTEKIRA